MIKMGRRFRVAFCPGAGKDELFSFQYYEDIITLGVNKGQHDMCLGRCSCFELVMNGGLQSGGIKHARYRTETRAFNEILVHTAYHSRDNVKRYYDCKVSVT